jgi:hypothetical protein
MSSRRTPEDEQRMTRIAELTLQMMIDALFVPCTKKHAWLFYHLTTGRGLFVFVAPGTLNLAALSRFAPQLPFGIAEIDPHLEEVLIEDGPSALRFDGARVVAYGN